MEKCSYTKECGNNIYWLGDLYNACTEVDAATITQRKSHFN